MFNLKDYVKEIRSMAEACKCTPEAAVDNFIVNLATFRNHYPGADELNFSELGQAWSKLLFTERNKQREETKQAVRNGRTREGREI